jgi:hypothetical protein
MSVCDRWARSKQSDRDHSRAEWYGVEVAPRGTVLTVAEAEAVMVAQMEQRHRQRTKKGPRGSKYTLAYMRAGWRATPLPRTRERFASTLGLTRHRLSQILSMQHLTQAAIEAA